MDMLEQTPDHIYLCFHDQNIEHDT
jgi:hypothetical protein